MVSCSTYAVLKLGLKPSCNGWILAAREKSRLRSFTDDGENSDAKRVG